MLLKVIGREFSVCKVSDFSEIDTPTNISLTAQCIHVRNFNMKIKLATIQDVPAQPTLEMKIGQLWK